MISTEIWSREIMDEELIDVFDQADHLATSAYREEFFTINHLMLSLLRTPSVIKILSNLVTASSRVPILLLNSIIFSLFSAIILSFSFCSLTPGETNE